MVGRYINELLVQWWEWERRILVWLGPGKHKNAEVDTLVFFLSSQISKCFLDQVHRALNCRRNL